MSAVSAPTFGHFAMEPLRGAFSHVMGRLRARSVAAQVEQGDGAPVLVIPGLATSGLSTSTLRLFLRSAGYRAYDWGLGRNVGPRGGIDGWLAPLERRLRDVSGRNGARPVHVIGWSLGGIYARELAKRCPRLVRQVVTLGSPLSADPDATNGRLLYRILCGDDAARDQQLLERIRTEPPVPCTSLYSKLDGVVSWEASRIDDHLGHRAIELEGVSHLGLVSDPRALAAVARAIAEQKAAATPGDRSAASAGRSRSLQP